MVGLENSMTFKEWLSKGGDQKCPFSKNSSTSIQKDVKLHMWWSMSLSSSNIQNTCCYHWQHLLSPTYTTFLRQPNSFHEEQLFRKIFDIFNVWINRFFLSAASISKQPCMSVCTTTYRFSRNWRTYRCSGATEQCGNICFGISWEDTQPLSAGSSLPTSLNIEE